MRDLAPGICRQRAIIEGIAPVRLTDVMIRTYLDRLAQVLDMVVLTEPVTHRSPKYGEAAWVHWETSGAHLYAWDEPVPFFSVDIYTCKPFELSDAVDYTRDYFACRHEDIVFKSV